MGIPVECTRVVFGGGLPGGEVWQSGYWIQGAAPTSNSSADSLANLTMGTLIDATSGPWNLLATFVDSTTTLNFVKVYSYPAGGPTAAFIGEKLELHAGTGPRAAGNQICVVATLLTGAAGRRHRGRMYLPWGKITNGITGQLLSADATSMANRIALHFSDWNASGDNGKIVVVSQVGTEALQVLSVRVDTRQDVQRRRANRQAVLFSQTTAVTP